MARDYSNVLIAYFVNKNVIQNVIVNYRKKTNHDVTSAKCTQYIYIYVTSGGSLVSPSIKTDHHVKTEVWLKLVLYNHKLI